MGVRQRQEPQTVISPKLWRLLTSSHWPVCTQTPEQSQDRCPNSTHPPKNCTGPLDLESFCFLFPHISGVGVFSKTQTHLLTKREKKLGEQGARGQRSDPSSQRATPGSLSSLMPAPNGCHRLLLAVSR